MRTPGTTRAYLQRACESCDHDGRTAARHDDGKGRTTPPRRGSRGRCGHWGSPPTGARSTSRDGARWRRQRSACRPTLRRRAPRGWRGGIKQAAPAQFLTARMQMRARTRRAGGGARWRAHRTARAAGCTRRCCASSPLRAPSTARRRRARWHAPADPSAVARVSHATHDQIARRAAAAAGPPVACLVQRHVRVDDEVGVRSGTELELRRVGPWTAASRGAGVRRGAHRVRGHACCRARRRALARTAVLLGSELGAAEDVIAQVVLANRLRIERDGVRHGVARRRRECAVAHQAGHAGCGRGDGALHVARAERRGPRRPHGATAHAAHTFCSVGAVCPLTDGVTSGGWRTLSTAPRFVFRKNSLEVSIVYGGGIRARGRTEPKPTCRY